VSKLPECTDGKRMAATHRYQIPEDEAGDFDIGDQYGVTARSLLLFELQTGAGS
jgi:hypothetical protein